MISVSVAKYKFDSLRSQISTNNDAQTTVIVPNQKQRSHEITENFPKNKRLRARSNGTQARWHWPNDIDNGDRIKQVYFLEIYLH